MILGVWGPPGGNLEWGAQKRYPKTSKSHFAQALLGGHFGTFLRVLNFILNVLFHAFSSAPFFSVLGKCLAQR